jgi:hypothetical protein
MPGFPGGSHDLANEAFWSCSSAPFIANAARANTQMVFRLSHGVLDEVLKLTTAHQMLICLEFPENRRLTVSCETLLVPVPQPHQHDGRRRFYLAVRG